MVKKAYRHGQKGVLTVSYCTEFFVILTKIFVESDELSVCLRQANGSFFVFCSGREELSARNKKSARLGGFLIGQCRRFLL